MAYTNEFSKYYDKLGWNNFSLAFFNTLKKYFPKENFKYLDAACGTGALAAKVVEINRSKVDAFDISPAMIKIAKEKSAKVNFFVDDMTMFKKENEYDVITCLHDAVNCLEKIRNWKKFFQNMFLSLKQGGIFVFDYNNLKARENWAREYVIEFDGCKIFQKGKKIKDGAKLNLRIQDTHGKILSENFINHMYKDKDIKNILKEAGFNIMKIEQNKIKSRNIVFAKK